MHSFDHHDYAGDAQHHDANQHNDLGHQTSHAPNDPLAHENVHSIPDHSKHTSNADTASGSAMLHNVLSVLDSSGIHDILGIVGDFVKGNGSETKHPHTDPTYTGPGVVGTPGQDMAHWHQQTQDTTCGVTSQEFILQSFGLQIGEDTLREEAMAQGWYISNGGTPEAHVGNLLAYHGIPIERYEGATFTQLTEKLENGQKVIVGVSTEDIWYHGSQNDLLAQYPGIPGQQATHAVEVIGINNTDPQKPHVVLNDPSTPDGQGIVIALTIFEQAWAISQHFLVTTPPASGQSVKQGSTRKTSHHSAATTDNVS